MHWRLVLNPNLINDKSSKTKHNPYVEAISRNEIEGSLASDRLQILFAYLFPSLSVKSLFSDTHVSPESICKARTL